MAVFQETISYTNLSAFKQKLRRLLEQAAAGLCSAVEFEGRIFPALRAADALAPFLNAFGGSAVLNMQQQEVSLTFQTSFYPLEPSQLADAPPDRDGFTGHIGTLLRQIAARGKENGSCTLADGLMHCGLLQGTGYHWSLSDHRARQSYGAHTKSFDELAAVTPLPDEAALDDLSIYYDLHELELGLLWYF